MRSLQSIVFERARRNRLRFLQAAATMASLMMALTVSSQTLRERIDRTMNGEQAIDQRHATLDEVFAALEAEPQPDLRLWSHAVAARAYALLESGRLEEGAAVIRDGLARTPMEQAPDQHVALRSTGATILLAAGRTEEAVAEFESILGNLPPGLDSGVALRARSNYALALYEAGQVLAATELLRELIPLAESLGNDRRALILANNLLVILIRRELYADAREWLQRVRSLRDRPNDEALLASVRLHELELQRVFGDPEGAARGLREFVQVSYDRPSVIGSAYEYLGDTERELGLLEEAERAGRRAIALLQPVPWELPDAHVALARTLLAMDRYAEALSVLEAIPASAEVSVARRATLASLGLEIRLRQAGLLSEAAELRQLLQDLHDGREVDYLQYIRYYDARLAAQQQQTEIARMVESEARLAAEAEAAEARARELEVRQGALSQQRNWVLGLGLILFVGLLAGSYALNRRSYQRKLLAAEQDRNRELTVAVEAQAALLKQQLQEQNEMELALREKKQMELIGQIAGNVAHDFNNLLQVIYSSNEELEATLTEPSAHLALQASKQSVDYARDMTRELLAYARQQELSTRPVDVVALLRDSQHLFRSAVGEEVSVVFDLPPRAVAMVDPAKLSTSVLNLLRNAADAMPSGGTVGVFVREQTVDESVQEQWPALEEGSYVMVRFADDGEGMDQHTMEKACEPFYSTKGEHAGTGLGLSSVYGFVCQTGGGMRIESQQSVGTTVTLAFPSASMSPAVAASGQVEPERESRDLRVLVVEDNDLVACAVCALLESVGAQVDRLRSADLAIERLNAGGEYHHVLSDVRMPGRHDGYDLARWVSEHRPSVSMILMSGFSDRRADNANYTVLNKPFSRAELLSLFSASQGEGARGPVSPSSSQSLH